MSHHKNKTNPGAAALCQVGLNDECKKKNVRILFLIVSKKHSLCLTFIYISAVVGLVLRRVIKKG